MKTLHIATNHGGIKITNAAYAPIDDECGIVTGDATERITSRVCQFSNTETKTYDYKETWRKVEFECGHISKVFC